MLCDFCHQNDAVFFIEKVTLGGRIKVKLCAECAQKRGVMPNSSSLERNIGSLFKEIANLAQKFEVEEKKVCPVCAISLGEIKRTQKVGCPECYEIFKNEIVSLMISRGMRGAYTGSMPFRLAKFRSALTDRNLIRLKLQEAIQKEDYERAAFYRDYLRATEKTPIVAENESGSS